MEIKAMIHSLKDLDTVTISKQSGNNVIAEYKGKFYTGIYNIFSGLYYIDDIYGEVKGDNQCQL